MTAFEYDFLSDPGAIDDWVHLIAAIIRNAILAAHPGRLQEVKDRDRELDVLWQASGATSFVEEVFKNNARAMRLTRELWAMPYRECLTQMGIPKVMGTEAEKPPEDIPYNKTKYGRVLSIPLVTWDVFGEGG